MGATPGLPPLHPLTRDTCDQVADRLASEAAEVADRMTTAVLEEVPAYATLRSAELRAVIFQHSLEHVHAVARTIRMWSLPTTDELVFVRERGAMRAAQHVPLSALLHSYRLGHRTVWQHLVEYLTGCDRVVEATLALTALTLAYTDVISGALAEGYTERQRQLLVQVDRDRRDALERILQGGFDRHSETARLASRFALVHGADYLVVVVTAEPSAATPPDSDAHSRAADTLRRNLEPGVAQPFVVVRHGEIISVAPLARARASALATLVRQAIAELQARGERWYAGTSTVCPSLGEVARGYQEARVALDMATSMGGTCALLEVRVSDYLLQRTDETALRMIPPAGRQVLQSAHADDRLLVETLRAHIRANLAVTETAEALAVHPNTVTYRLRKLGQRLDRDLGKFSELVEVMAWLRVVDQLER